MPTVPQLLSGLLHLFWVWWGLVRVRRKQTWFLGSNSNLVPREATCAPTVLSAKCQVATGALVRLQGGEGPAGQERPAWCRDSLRSTRGLGVADRGSLLGKQLDLSGFFASPALVCEFRGGCPSQPRSLCCSPSWGSLLTGHVSRAAWDQCPSELPLGFMGL